MKSFARSQRGLSMIELMVALLIAFMLSLGIVQIFGASRTTYQTQEGLSRVQESGRYVTQFLQRQLRMVGYMGCGSDTERSSQASFVNHFATYNAAVPGGDAVDPHYRFQRPIEAFDSGSMPAYLVTDTAAGLGVSAPLTGTDVLVVRVLGDDTVPIVSVAYTGGYYTLSVTVASATAPVFTGTTAGTTIPFGMQTCRSVDVFAASQTGVVVSAVGDGGTVAYGSNAYMDPTVTTCTPLGPCPWDFRISNAFLNAPDGSAGLQLNGELHRAEFYVFYAATNSAGVPGLYMKRFNRGAPDPSKVGAAEELAEGVEAFKVNFGVDTNADGQIDGYDNAAQVAAIDTTGTTAGLDAAWRSVISVRLGMLIRSPDYSAVQGGAARTYSVLGNTVTPVNNTNGTMRQVYETTIALRNRIFNS